MSLMDTVDTVERAPLLGQSDAGSDTMSIPDHTFGGCEPTDDFGGPDTWFSRRGRSRRNRDGNNAQRQIDIVNASEDNFLVKALIKVLVLAACSGGGVWFYKMYQGERAVGTK